MVKNLKPFDLFGKFFISGEVLHSIEPKCKKIAKIYENISFLMILAKGTALPIAREGALKIKETTYIHAEAFTSGEMKHGPIALINAEKNEETKGFF